MPITLGRIDAEKFSLNKRQTFFVKLKHNRSLIAGFIWLAGITIYLLISRHAVHFGAE